jgi:hypothetical protein
MATSPYNDTVLVLDFLGKLIYQKPASVLDVGSGFGRWGFLCRCHLGYGLSLTTYPDQQLRIDAVEAFPSNVTPHYACIYDHTYVGDAVNLVPTLGDYDVIICSHMIEHLEKAEGARLIEFMLKKARVALILALPFGDRPQGAEYGNEFERHRSVWSKRDFMSREVFVQVYDCEGLVIFPRSDEARWQVRMMRSPVRRFMWRLFMTMRGARVPAS